ncbi:hypothetical protein PS1_031576 [Malus domestica]
MSNGQDENPFGSSFGFARTTVQNAKFEVEKFDGTNNFGMWQCEVKDVLAQQDLLAALGENSESYVEVGMGEIKFVGLLFNSVIPCKNSEVFCDAGDINKCVVAKIGRQVYDEECREPATLEEKAPPLPIQRRYKND